MDYKQEQFLRMQQYQYAPQMPFYMSYPIQNIYMTEMEYERDMERMKELYPDEARQIQKLVEEECDKMEYEGSMMFDEYPDRLMLKVICERIYENAMQPQPQAMAEQEVETEQVEQQNFRPGHGHGHGRPPGPPGWPPPQNPGLGTLIEVLLYNEMYKRRCRHNRCRRWW